MKDLLYNFEDYTKISTFIKSQNDELIITNENLIKYSKKINLFNLILILKAAKSCQSLLTLFKENFQHFSKNISDNFALLNLFFIKEISDYSNNYEFQKAKLLTMESFEEQYAETKKISMNISNISLKIDQNLHEIAMKDENEPEEILNIQKKFNFESNLDFKKYLNFNENILETIINFFKVILVYSASFIRLLLFFSTHIKKKKEKISLYIWL